MPDGLLRRIWLLGVPLGVAAAAIVIWVVHPGRDSGSQHEVTVKRSTLRPGQIVLVVVNGSEDPARIAQLILNDAFVDFRASQRTVQPGAAARLTGSPPRARGEAYDIDLMASACAP